MEKQSILLDYLAGGIGGCAGITVGHPFDTVKVQLQTRAGQDSYRGVFDCIQSVKEQKLSKGFFRGMSWPLLSYTAINSVYFGVYGTVLSFLEQPSKGNTSSVMHYVNIAIAGGVAGLGQLPIACPIDTIKVYLQSQIPHFHKDKTHVPGVLGGKEKFHKGPLSASVDIVRNRGPQGLFRGFGTQLFRDIPASSLYILSFELLSDVTSRMLPRVPSTVINFFCGGIAGVLSWLIILPLDVVKSRLQSDPERKLYKGFWECVRKSYRSEGLSMFFRGGMVMSIRAFPVNAVTLMVYTESLVLLKGLNVKKV